MRSFFPEMPVPGTVFNALNYFRKQAIAKWMNQSVYMQGMIALIPESHGGYQNGERYPGIIK